LTPENHGKSGVGDGQCEEVYSYSNCSAFFGTPSSAAEDEEMVPLPTAIKLVVVSKLGMNISGESVLSKEDNHDCGGEESNTLSKDNTGYDSPCEE
jgi:hypothetical protein